MVLRPLKSYLPRSLFGRAALIVILPLLALQLVVAFVFIQRHYEGVTRQMTRNIAREIAVAQQVIDTSPTADIAQVRLFNLSKPLAIALELLDAADDRMVNRRNFFDLSGRALIQEMTRLLGGEVAVDLASNRRVVTVRLPTEKGILRVLIPRTRVTVSNPHQLLVLMVVASIILIGIAFLFLTTQVRPIRRLADAAEAFGKGRNLTFRPAGAEEVRRAGLAFIAMRGRLERLIETRTSMLAGVSHDLRTPLTRMKLSLALIDDPEAKAMLRDVTVMEDMVEAFLAFARGDQLDEIEDVAPEAVLADAVEAARRSGIEVETVTDAAQGGEMALRRKGVARALQNLIDNAADHGGRVRATLRLLPRTCEFVVEDDGPGIPTESREAVLRPFVKLDRARNLDRRGGVGLGLAIAQDVARAHGGALELSDSTDLGGLRALLRLPR